MMEELKNQPFFILQYSPSFYKNVYILFHLIFLAVLIPILFTYHVEEKLFYHGYYQDGEIHVIVDKNFFSLLENQLVLLDKSYSYQTKKIEPMTYQDGEILYWDVRIDFSLPNKWKIENHQFLFEFIKSKDTLIKNIVNKIKKGLGL